MFGNDLILGFGALSAGAVFLLGLYRFVRVTQRRDDEMYARLEQTYKDATESNKANQEALAASSAMIARLQQALGEAQSINLRLSAESRESQERIKQLTENVASLRHTVASLERVIDALMEVVAAANDAGVTIPPGIKTMLRDHRFARLAEDIEHEGGTTIENHA